ncbi:uncharacterized protein BO80DRAFT_434175 [Aspergillus ibericus CBS 121593]|uniref:Uncharacterized protein n=1 Tax=Aspergillus ibericus CBS 121593 TaxID=1448316 RepID=A0A395H164_9EURO|nr:hypothetical protein BO80DRAFT_434175 [Aspergillus ibericus CBS 121593]RAL01596.1 hypothetical protein BO80DRAFT_434175 [Aspergillus ibericus CBS 121593]
MASSGRREYIPLEALNTNAEDNHEEAEEEQPHRKRRNLWHRIDTTSVLTVFLGFPLLLLAVTLLALFWHGSMKAIDGAEPEIYWVRVVNAGWATRLVTVCTASIRTVVAFQAGLVTAMVAGIVLETTGVPLLLGPFYSMLRAVKVAPSNLWTATNFQPHLSRFIYALVLIEVLVTAASQFLSTILLSDFANGTFTQRSNSTNVNVLNTTDNGLAGGWWYMPPAASWTFAELSGSFEDRSGFHDTGHTFRAFLPFEEEAQRTKLHRLRGPVPVMDHRVVCASPPLINLSLDATLESYVHLSGQIPTENLTYPLLIDPDSQPYINFTCELPTPNFWDNNTVGETSLCIPKSRLNWTVLIEDPLIQPDGFPEASTLFIVLDVVSTAAIIGTLGTPAVQTIRTDGPWTIVNNGSAHIETLRISACLTNLAMQTFTVGMNSTSDNLEPKTAWDQYTQSYNTEPSRLQLGVSSPGNTSSANHRGILTLDPRSQWEIFHPPADTLGVDPTPFFKAILIFPTFLNSYLLNYTYDPGVILSRKDPGIIFGNAHPSHVDLFQDTLITTASPALAVQALLTRIYQMAYYDQLVQLNSPVAAVTMFSLTAAIPVQWTGFVLGTVLIVIHSITVVVVLVRFVRSAEISFIGSYWQTVAQVVSKETRPILEEADRMDDGAVKGWAKREEVVESLGVRRVLRRRPGGRVTLGLVENGEENLI